MFKLKKISTDIENYTAQLESSMGHHKALRNEITELSSREKELLLNAIQEMTTLQAKQQAVIDKFATETREKKPK